MQEYRVRKIGGAGRGKVNSLFQVATSNLLHSTVTATATLSLLPLLIPSVQQMHYEV